MVHAQVQQKKCIQILLYNVSKTHISFVLPPSEPTFGNDNASAISSTNAVLNVQISEANKVDAMLWGL